MVMRNTTSTNSDMDRNSRTMLWTILALIAIALIGYIAYAYRDDTTLDNTRAGAYGTNDNDTNTMRDTDNSTTGSPAE